MIRTTYRNKKINKSFSLEKMSLYTLTATAFGPSSARSRSKSSKFFLLPIGNLQYPSGVQYPSPVYVSTGISSSRMSKIIRSGLRLGLSKPSKIDGPTSKLYFPPLCIRLNVCALPPHLMCDSKTSTLSPYLAERAPQARPPIPLPITTTSYSPPSPDSPLPVPG